MRLATHFRDAARNCSDLAGLRALIVDATHELGFRYVALLHHSSLSGTNAHALRIENYPEDWREEFLKSGFARDDPVHRASRRASSGFEWRELDRFVHLKEPQKKILERSRFFGLGEGMTVPVNVPGEPAGSCSFAVPVGKSLPRGRLQCAELIGTYAFAAARRLSGLPRRTRVPHLSRREIDCLRLVAIGKTDAEIAIILKIGRETVRQYLKRARAAYDVVTRTQLVVLGLRDDWIGFDELLPP